MMAARQQLDLDRVDANLSKDLARHSEQVQKAQTDYDIASDQVPYLDTMADSKIDEIEARQEAQEYRMLRKSRNIKERLGVKDPIGRIIFKPKGMHQKTFDRLRFQAERCEYIGWINIGRSWGLGFDPQIKSLLSQINATYC